MLASIAHTKDVLLNILKGQEKRIIFSLNVTVIQRAFQRIALIGY